MKIIYLSTTQVLAIHDQILKRFEGSTGLRDLSLIESAVGRPQATFDQTDLYVSIFEKAAALLQSLLKNHPFVDGNKRTALTSAAIFLELNGYILNNSHDEEVAFALDVNNQRLSVEEISKWLQSHTSKQ